MSTGRPNDGVLGDSYLQTCDNNDVRQPWILRSLNYEMVPAKN